jgi:glycosyltransferase involved in cell wall biosynthesis
MRTPIAPVTVLMPVYNAQRYLAGALESILGQTFADFQFLIIDDGSTDNSLAILRRYARHDVRMRLISRENRGLVATLNEGIALARGEYIARMDADDIALPRRLEFQVWHMDANPDVVCLGGYYDLIDYRGRLLTTMRPPTDHAGIEKEMLAGHTPICHPSAMVRREAIAKAGAYDPSMMLAEDLDLWLRLGEIGTLANLPMSLVRYRLHGQSVSERAGLIQRQTARQACERAWRRRGIQGHFEAVEPARPQQDRRSRRYFALLYGWWAFNSGQRRTALAYGLKGVALAPWDKEAFRLLVCAAIKHMPDKSDHGHVPV